MYSIRLNDGTLMPVNYAGEADGILVINADISIIEAYTLFMAHQFDSIAFLYGEEETAYSGYTALQAVIATGNRTSISLKRSEE